MMRAGSLRSDTAMSLPHSRSARREPNAGTRLLASAEAGTTDGCKQQVVAARSEHRVRFETWGASCRRRADRRAAGAGEIVRRMAADGCDALRRGAARPVAPKATDAALYRLDMNAEALV
jgi:hypothetical protein